MAETRFWSLSPAERTEAVSLATRRLRRADYLLEKDIWVVTVLDILFSAPFGGDLVFKGGTSLSKAWGAVRRFSEDVDITYDIRVVAKDLVADAGRKALPLSRSQEQKWTKTIRARLPVWVRDTAAPTLAAGIVRVAPEARFRIEEDRVYVDYAPLFETHGIVVPTVMVEFGARSTGEPHTVRDVVCDAAPFVPDVAFPAARPAAMLAERTFWEKATAAHVYCRRGRARGRRDHLSRHWHDLVRLERTGFAERALADHQLAMDVANHKAIFFREKDQAGHWVDYRAAVSGRLQLVPTGTAREQLAKDHRLMVESGILLDDWEPFGELMDACAGLERRANGR